ncbi:hypothetical protein [Thiopseudomonas denitrificans]|uniref:hypothetical protein n=1 Tax=Thiopseudomonas denitrificans TaxID=1501432 RepID=UPI001061EDDB|nr:hypothetical protein [Thiopseudomonas denitrificans]
MLIPLASAQVEARLAPDVSPPQTKKPLLFRSGTDSGFFAELPRTPSSRGTTVVNQLPISICNEGLRPVSLRTRILRKACRHSRARLRFDLVTIIGKSGSMKLLKPAILSTYKHKYPKKA